MSPEQLSVAALRRFWRADAATAGEADYTLLAQVDGAYVARSRAGLPALVVPMQDLSQSPVGRRASGCELIGHPSTRFLFQGLDKVGPAAALVCDDPNLVDAFAVLALDVAKRTREGGGTWSSLLALVEEWQMLLAPRGRPTVEKEAGLWGELWFLSRANAIEQALAGWCGPSGDATDFFSGGKSAEVKTSQRRRQHHVSFSQVAAPVGDQEAWMLSIWVKLDPSASSTVVQLADGILDRVEDQGAALRRLARAGYSPANRSGYTSAFVVLAEPEWYRVEDIPRVRVADPGVSQLRYRVALDEARRADAPSSESLWRHFHGHPYGGE